MIKEKKEKVIRGKRKNYIRKGGRKRIKKEILVMNWWKRWRRNKKEKIRWKKKKKIKKNINMRKGIWWIYEWKGK